eukprot:gene6654-8233_t
MNRVQSVSSNLNVRRPQSAKSKSAPTCKSIPEEDEDDSLSSSSRNNSLKLKTSTSSTTSSTSTSSSSPPPNNKSPLEQSTPNTSSSIPTSTSLNNSSGERSHQQPSPHSPQPTISIRKRTIDELVRVEKGYVNDMTTLIDVFYNPFKNEDLIPKDHLYTLFCNICELRALHHNFLITLEKRCSNWDNEKTTVGDLFLPMMGPFQKLYEVYINNYEKAFSLTKYIKISPNYSNVQKLIYSYEKDPRCRSLDFGSFLVMPVQRLPRYLVLLKEIEKNTTQMDHPDLNLTQLALVQLHDLTLYLNESKRKSSDVDKIQEIKNSVFGVDSVIGGSKYIMEGPLSMSKGLVASSKKDLYVYLFKECIICAEPYQNGNSSSSNSKNKKKQSKHSTPTSLSASLSTSTASGRRNSNENVLSGGVSISSSSSLSSSSLYSSLSATLSHHHTGSNNNSSGNSPNGGSPHNTYHSTLFKSIMFSDVKAISNLKNFKDSFQVVTSKKVYTFVASTTEIRDKWMSSMQDCMNCTTPPPSPTTTPKNSRLNSNSSILSASSNSPSSSPIFLSPAQRRRNRD